MILILNPGTHPEMMRMAGGLIAAGSDVRYLTASSWASDSIVQKYAEHPKVSSTALATDLRRRQLPHPITNSHVVGLARGRELINQIARKTNIGDAAQATRMRNREFQRRACRYIRETPNIQAVVGQYTASTDVFRECLSGVTKILNYPIAHHRWLKDAMQKEADSNPKWKHLLQGHDFTSEQLNALDEEIGMADAILVPSTFAASTFIMSGVPAEKLIVTPLGCDPRPDPSPTAIKAELEGEKLRVLFAGQVTQRKGVGYLVEAVHKLDDAELLIVGPSTPEARDLVERHRNVTVRPSVPRQELYQLMDEADILVLPSLAEGFPLGAIEAMANGTPCLVSNATFGTDVIVHGDNGYILDTVSVDSIVEALTEIGRARETLVGVGIRAAETATDFSWARYSRDIAEEIEELCERARKA